jgi:hypothetical protein
MNGLGICTQERLWQPWLVSARRPNMHSTVADRTLSIFGLSCEVESVHTIVAMDNFGSDGAVVSPNVTRHSPYIYEWERGVTVSIPSHTLLMSIRSFYLATDQS